MKMKFFRVIWSLFLLMVSKPVYGGQAVVQGVMMRGKDHYAIAVHNEQGLQVETFEFKSIRSRFKPLGWPFIRGIVAFVEAMIIGYKSLMHSANMAAAEEEGEEMSVWLLVGTVALSVVLGLALFKFLPLGVATLLDSYFAVPSWVFNIIDGVVTLLIFVLYLYLIGRAEDIKDLFRYHGGEHKAINCLEEGKSLSLKNILASSQVHLRCGTTFIFVVFLLSILVYIAIPKTLPFFVNLGLRTALLPLIAALSFELQQFSARKNIWVLRTLITPGLWLQSFTVNTPRAKHARAARSALEAVIAAEK
jgi:uncharacterized protein YqhQ